MSSQFYTEDVPETLLHYLGEVQWSSFADLGCGGWSNSISGLGLTVDSIGSFIQQDCNVFLRVSCCALVP